jgi:hypothetical protein
VAAGKRPDARVLNNASKALDVAADHHYIEAIVANSSNLDIELKERSPCAFRNA